MIELESPGAILPHQQMYADELPVMNISEYLKDKEITNPAGLRSTSKQGMGALIWLHQTRPDIGFATTQIAPPIAEACESSEKSVQIANPYNKIAKFAKNRQRRSRYSRFQ